MRILYPTDLSSRSIHNLVSSAEDEVIFLGDPRIHIQPRERMFERMYQVIRESGAGVAYSDAVGQPRIDYQLGSIRDNFDFGPLLGISIRAAREAGFEDEIKWGGLYDLRLRISERHRIVRIPEPLYSASIADSRSSGDRQFDYVDPRNRDYQIEMERIATSHLKRINAWLAPVFEAVAPPVTKFPVKASVIIPVRNREKTIRDSVTSALSQKAAFQFNVIVVNNHSTDGTSEILQNIMDARLVHMIPKVGDLGIGGCWNEAIYSDQCGRYAVQLDSDDLYLDDRVLSRVVEELDCGPYAMVVGAYSIVDFFLNAIPPGLIDHREWTRDNGRNNALRINGLGAPRAFDTSILRTIGFPNVSYGEDYAVGLRISRDYEVGRIHDSLYLCRRWEGNTDNALSAETINRYDFYKDWLRSVEIQARQTAALE